MRTGRIAAVVSTVLGLAVAAVTVEHDSTRLGERWDVILRGRP